MLTEEWERREMLEKMQEEQKTMLNMERMKREEFEKIQDDREIKAKLPWILDMWSLSF